MENKPQPAAHLSVSIVLFHSSLDHLRSTLQSLLTSCSTALESGFLHTLSVSILDNSEDVLYRDQVQSLLENLSSSEKFTIKYHAVPENVGFGAGNNIFVDDLRSDFHLVLNPDVEIAQSAISCAIKHLQEDEEVVLLCPRVSSDDGSQEFLCKRFPTVLVLLLRAFAPRFLYRLFQTQLDYYEMRDICSGTAIVDVELASGCFMVIRTPAFKEVGGFNEKYFLYFEDFDLSLRLRSLGRTVFDPDVEIIHHGGYAASKGLGHVAMFIRSGIRFFNAHGWRLI